MRPREVDMAQSHKDGKRVERKYEDEETRRDQGYDPPRLYTRQARVHALPHPECAHWSRDLDEHNRGWERVRRGPPRRRHSWQPSKI